MVGGSKTLHSSINAICGTWRWWFHQKQSEMFISSYCCCISGSKSQSWNTFATHGQVTLDHFPQDGKDEV